MASDETLQSVPERFSRRPRAGGCAKSRRRRRALARPPIRPGFTTL